MKQLFYVQQTSNVTISENNEFPMCQPSIAISDRARKTENSVKRLNTSSWMKF